MWLVTFAVAACVLLECGAYRTTPLVAQVKLQKRLLGSKRTPSESSEEGLLRSTLASITCLTDAGQEAAISNAGLLYLALEQPKKALEMFRASVQLNELRDSSWFNLAVLEADAGTDDDVVLEAYGKALAVTESTTVASACFNNAFELLLRTRRLEEAALWADAALQQLPQDPTAWFNVGVVMRESGNLEWAVSCLEKAAHELPASGASASDLSSHASRALALTMLADVHSKRGDLMSAVQCYKEATEADPSDYESLYNMALLYRDRLMDEGSALTALTACVALCPQHTQAVFQLAAMQAGTGAGTRAAEVEVGGECASHSTPLSAPTQAPPGYISQLFDHYAHAGYENHMLHELQYRGNELVVGALLDAAAAGRGGGVARLLGTGPAPDAEMVSRVLDLGCGTGLVGRTWRARGALGILLGCDLSPRMVAAASDQLYERRKEGGRNKVTSKVYEHVEVSDCEAFVRSLARGSITAALAGDVLCYYGDLGPLLGAVSDALVPGGLFAFTVEAFTSSEEDKEEDQRVGPGGGDGYVLRPSARFAHSRTYVLRTAAEAGLVLVGAEDGGSAPGAAACRLGEMPATLRLQGGEPVLGAVYVFAKKD